MSEAQLFVANTFTEMYERDLVGPLFRPFAEQLVTRVGLNRADSVIDVACGTGIVARVARERLGPEGRIVGVDVAPAMLAVARSVDSTIDWRQGNAIALPVAAGEHFTVLTCHQGLQFMPDKAAAIREMRRVLAPGGRIAIATWCSLEDTPGMPELNVVAERHVGRIVDSRHSFGDASALKSLLVDAGFSHVNVNTLAHDVQFADGALFARLNAMAVIGMSEKGKAMGEVERGELARPSRRREPGCDCSGHEEWHIRAHAYDQYRDSRRLTPAPNCGEEKRRRPCLATVPLHNPGPPRRRFSPPSRGPGTPVPERLGR
jgi:ubiquinone/menaquinone biosynthesis C-methylase UbiE